MRDASGGARGGAWSIALLLVVSGCGATEGDTNEAAPQRAPATTAATTTTPPPAPADASGLVAEVGESRLFGTRDQLRLGLTNDGGEPVAVATVQLDSPLFEVVAPNRRDTVLAPGQTVSIPLDRGGVDCAGDEPDEAHVVVVADGVSRRLTAALPSVTALARVHAAACDALATAAAVGVGFEDTWEPAGPASAAGHLLLEQRATGTTAELDDVRGSVVFSVTPPEGAASRQLLVVDDEEQTARLPVVVTAARCDAHALIESKKTYVFIALIALDGRKVRPVAFGVEGETRRVLDSLIAACVG